MKNDWPTIRITALLYFIVILIPFNYYFAKQSFESKYNDAATMKELVFISGALQHLAHLGNIGGREQLINEIDTALKNVEQSFIKFPANLAYVELFRADENFHALQNAYTRMKITPIDTPTEERLSRNAFKELNGFAQTAEAMMNYKLEVILDKLFLSLLFTMISVVTLIFFVRLYIKLQLTKHSVHDHVTGLYNKKYFNHVLEHAQTLAKRQNRSLALLTLSITNYPELRASVKKKELETHLQAFATVFGHFFRQSDTVCRIEEECFATIAPDATLENILKVSKKLQHKLESALSSANVPMRIRIGVAVYEEQQPLLEAAKRNMDGSAEIGIGGA